MNIDVTERFKLTDKTVIITGGAGLLGRKHAEAVIEGGGIPILLDINQNAIEAALADFSEKYGQAAVSGYAIDITKKAELEKIKEEIINRYDHIDGLINNAANNPKVENSVKNMQNTRFENFPVEIWNEDLLVGLTGAFFCAQVFGSVMAAQGTGVILNISSDLGIIAPDQRIYRREGIKEEEQMVKPVTYSVIKHGLIGMTKYLATYWADKGVRCNALCPAGICNGQNAVFLDKLTNLIPMGRMADANEYKATVLYLISEASAYMTGSTVIVDGGRTCW